MNKDDIVNYYRSFYKQDNKYNTFNITLMDNRKLFQLHIKSITESGIYVKVYYAMFYDPRRYYYKNDGFIPFQEIRAIGVYQKGDIDRYLEMKYPDKDLSKNTPNEEKQEIYAKYIASQKIPHLEDDGEINLV